MNVIQIVGATCAWCGELFLATRRPHGINWAPGVGSIILPKPGRSRVLYLLNVGGESPFYFVEGRQCQDNSGMVMEGNVEFILSSSYCQIHLVTFILSSSHCQVHLVKFILSCSSCHVHLVKFILSSLSWQVHLVKFILSSSSRQVHLVKFILLSTFCQVYLDGSWSRFQFKWSWNIKLITVGQNWLKYIG